MRLSLHAVVCCCVFTSVLPLVEGTAGELDTGLKRRFKVWLQSRVKRDLCSSSSSMATDNEQLSDVHVGPQQDGNAKSVPPPSSCGLHIRPGRSTSAKSSGCKFVTCVVHDLLHRLKQNNELKSCAPENKIGSKGYGRRRRRALPDAARLALRTGRQRQSPEAASKVSSAAEAQERPCRSSPKEPEN